MNYSLITAVEEAEIDRMVSALNGLMAEEIKVVDPDYIGTGGRE